MRSAVRRTWSSACALLAFGCGGAAPAAGPRPAVAAFARALERGDADGTYALLDEARRRGRSDEEHRALMQTNAAELREQGRSLREALGTDAVEARAHAELRTGETVVLVLEADGWRIDGGVLDAAGLGSPLDAVAALRRALMRRDLPGIERVLSRQTRAEWEEEVRALVDATADELDLEVELEGNRAHVRTTGGGSIELVRESGEWRVVDVRPAGAPP
ncbi:MAG: hypothetical protein AB7S26_22425 [Sandaracinaceae bacterium]